ncbi:unnamed protein product [Orchesella dallaii]|uniref:Uncharacterized protein n=1 Tax=Orchesella dallaii TaxID=48710 RepID=A0ABP1QHC4_9HEXA
MRRIKLKSCRSAVMQGKENMLKCPKTIEIHFRYILVRKEENESRKDIRDRMSVISIESASKNKVASLVKKIFFISSAETQLQSIDFGIRNGVFGIFLINRLSLEIYKTIV